MVNLAQSTIETRSAQMFFALEPAEIERVRRFGICRSYAAGDALANVGEVAQGLTIIISGHVDVFRRDPSGSRQSIVTHGPGSFMGELAQLSGRPALVDAIAKDAVQALNIPTERLRALLVGKPR
jgi:thioredoxin reductase (NADPH)